MFPQADCYVARMVNLIAKKALPLLMRGLFGKKAIRENPLLHGLIKQKREGLYRSFSFVFVLFNFHKIQNILENSFREINL